MNGVKRYYNESIIVRRVSPLADYCFWLDSGDFTVDTQRSPSIPTLPNEIRYPGDNPLSPERGLYTEY